MANFAELNAKEMNETNGGIAPILIPVFAVPIVTYAAYKLSRSK